MILYLFCTAIIVREIHDFPQILNDSRFVLIIYIVHDDRLSYIRTAKLNHSFNVIPKICDKDICITFEMKETVRKYYISIKDKCKGVYKTRLSLC